MSMFLMIRFSLFTKQRGNRKPGFSHIYWEREDLKCCLFLLWLFFWQTSEPFLETFGDFLTCWENPFFQEISPHRLGADRASGLEVGEIGSRLKET